jgi:hypothetical protein
VYIGEDPLKKTGRKPYIPPEVIEAVKKRQRIDDLSKNSGSNDEIITKLQEEYKERSKRLQRNPMVFPEMNSRTEQRYVHAVAPELENCGQLINKSREDALRSIYNPICHASTINALMEKLEEDGHTRLLKRNIYNLDATTSLISAGKTTPLRMAEGSREELKELHRNPATRGEVLKRRGIKQVYLTCGDSRLVCAVIIIKDRTITKLAWEKLSSDYGYDLWILFQPAAKEIQGSSREDTDNDLQELLDDTEGISEIGTVTIETEIMQIILKDMFIPCMLRKRDNALSLIHRTIDANASVSHDSSGSSAPPSTSSAVPPEMELSSSTSDNEPILLTLDGDYSQIEATFRCALDICAEHNIEVLKFPGGTSLMYQPNDLMRSHQILKSVVKSMMSKAAKGRALYKEFEDCEMDPIALRVERLLFGLHMPKASRDCFVNFFRILPLLLQKAFTMDVIRKGWKLSGLVPFDVEQIFQQCSAWHDCSHDEALAIMDAIPRISLKTAMEGICTDEMIFAELGNVVGPPERNRDATVLNNRRTLWLNSEAAREIYRKKKAAKMEKLQMLEDRRHRQEEKARGVDALTLATKAVRDGRVLPLSGLNEEYEVCMCARNACMKVRFNNGKGSADDKWRGCPTGCKRWFCPLATCMTAFWNKHLPKCVAQTQFGYDGEFEDE